MDLLNGERRPLGGEGVDRMPGAIVARDASSNAARARPDHWVALDPTQGLQKAASRLLSASDQLRWHDARIRPLAVEGNLLLSADGRWLIDTWSRSQLRRRAQCALRQPITSARLLNAGLERARGDALVRIEGGVVRAVLASSYRTLDEHDAFDGAIQGMKSLDLIDELVPRAVGSGSIAVLRVTRPSARIEGCSGDAYEPGFDVRTSRIGLAAFSIIPIVFRLVCSNTFCGEAALRWSHRSSSPPTPETIRGGIIEALRRAEMMLGQWRHLSALQSDCVDLDAVRIFRDANSMTEASYRSTADRLRCEGAAHRLLRRIDVSAA